MGGTDDPSNLIELTVEEHANAHMKLYEQYRKVEDLCAYYMLSGKNQDPEFVTMQKHIAGKGSQKARKNRGLVGAELFYGRKVTKEELSNNSAKGGLVQGARNAESGHMTRIQKMSNPSEAGKKGGATTIARGKGSFADPAERLKSASKGGKTQGKRNAESGHLQRIAQLPNPRSKGKQWITNGNDNKMITKGDVIPKGYCAGKTQKK